jgi:hypothetical protein
MVAAKKGAGGDDDLVRKPSGPLTDLVLTLPIFVGYHLGE